MGIQIAGRDFPIDTEFGFFNMYDPGGLDATVERCVGRTPEPCGEGGVLPYGAKVQNTRPRRYSARKALTEYGKDFAGPDDLRRIPLAAVQQTIRQFVIHWDGMYSSRSCFDVLHNERGLSCHFL